MRYSREKQASNRTAIVTAATKLFKEKGFAGVGIDSIAKAAGLTSGALYSQFSSKEDVFDAVLESQLEGLLARWLQFRGTRPDWLEAGISQYLSFPHCENVGGGCPVTSLSRDAARRKKTRCRYQVRLTATVEGLREAVGAGSRDRLWALYSLMVGGMTLARGMEDEAAAKEVLDACRKSALEIISKNGSKLS
jgi:TetR/AcrR family transcriptional regulator, transcriptional repressor for nem operon